MTPQFWAGWQPDGSATWLGGCDAVCDEYAADAGRLICTEGGATADFAAQCLHTNVGSFRDGGEIEQRLQGGHTGKSGVHRWQWLAFLLHDFEHRGGSGFDFLHGFFWSLAEGETVAQGGHAGDVTFVIGAVGDGDLVGDDFHVVWCWFDLSCEGDSAHTGLPTTLPCFDFQGN